MASAEHLLLLSESHCGQQLRRCMLPFVFVGSHWSALWTNNESGSVAVPKHFREHICTSSESWQVTCRDAGAGADARAAA